LKENLNRVDNWRGVLSLIVCFGHLTQLLCSPELHSKWTSMFGVLAHISVLIFFFLSGFVITSSLEKRFKKKDSIIKIFISYFSSRFKRIYPPLIAMIFFIIVLKIYIKSTFTSLPYEFMFSLRDIVEYVLMIKVSLGRINAPLWSLIIEWWFYFVGFLLFYLIGKQFVVKIIGTIFLFFIFNYILIKLNQQIIIYFLIWLLGVFFYILRILNYKNLLILISLILFIYVFIYKNILFINIDISNLPSYQFLSLFSLIGFIFLLNKNSFLSFISSFSYSIYIFHYPIFIFIKVLFYKNGINNWGVVISIFIFSIVVSYIFSLIFEKNCHNIFKSFYKKKSIF
jgi:peptidoglycan/LPS O-acetylase OafA/YrhL